MVPEQLEPRLDQLREEYVLVQAWKKTASYIRYHNWFSDTLALDRAAVNLPGFLGEIRERLQSPEGWQNDPLRIVPAPKSQRWTVEQGAWKLDKNVTASARLRPLAHVSLADQVVATGLMLCLADRVETLQGDPRGDVGDHEARARVVSYGNRLFCYAIDGQLRHPWGSTKLYRKYSKDYATFLSRPEGAAKSLPDSEGEHFHVIHADLRQFYDRVRPEALAASVKRVRQEGDDPRFFWLAESLLNWRWHSRDESDVRMYAAQAGLDDFTRVALPQGLVASGFFANIALLAFDDVLRAVIGTEISPGIRVADSCRYVDDLRILVASAPEANGSLDEVMDTVSDWLGQTLEENATGLLLSGDKTRIAALGGDERPLVRQSARMNRIQSAVSGGFDALAGEEILDSIQGLMRAQEVLRIDEKASWRLSPVPDVRDETVARFSAGRYRTTFRSIRPLLQDEDPLQESGVERDDKPPSGRLRVTRTRRDLDDDTRAFALGLIQRWINDPSNVRLLRIGLDLWPDAGLLREVLSLLRPFTEKGGRRKAPRRVAWYCLAEILRAGATETGLVADIESLPLGIDLGAYREELRQEAVRIVGLPRPTLPWYLRQQALLFLATCDPGAAPVLRTGRSSETRHYRELIRFLRGEHDNLRSSDFATLAILARRSFVDRTRAVELTQPSLSPSRKRQIAYRDPSFFLELTDADTHALLLDDLPARIREDLCRIEESPDSGYDTLAKVVLDTHPDGPLRNELSLLRFAAAFLGQWQEQDLLPAVVTPVQVHVKVTKELGIAAIADLRILGSRTDPSNSLYEPPVWCTDGERWRIQLGFLLRFILSGQRDFTQPVHGTSWRETQASYRGAKSHWYQRMYGFYNAQSDFGDDWVPITEWMEGFLMALLRWPGCQAPRGFGWVEQGIDDALMEISQRIAELQKCCGDATGVLVLPLLAKRPTATTAKRPLRACVVQTVVPSDGDFHHTDLALNDPGIRRRHRNHLSAALAAVERTLALRETHKGRQGRLDWLILPELAVHPQDVRTHLMPFAQTHKTTILTGLTYEAIRTGQPLVNSALWIIPEWSEAYGLQIRTRRQGKAHLAPDERTFNTRGTPLLRGFRRCQWLIGYPWSDAADARPVWLTAAVCYDATDLDLAADLRDVSDILAIPALNKDVKTFDQMALALHYHMFQLVVVANNGQYGGSNAYWPRSDPHIRQVFHTYGQPQASIAFLEIDDIEAFLERHDTSGKRAADWKHPPAGLRFTPPRVSP